MLWILLELTCIGCNKGDWIQVSMWIVDSVQFGRFGSSWLPGFHMCCVYLTIRKELSSLVFVDNERKVLDVGKLVCLSIFIPFYCIRWCVNELEEDEERLI